jgi:SulP family sulfate permease
MMTGSKTAATGKRSQQRKTQGQEQHMLAKVVPFMAWFKNYDKASLQLDALSGLTVALVLIPQSMAYAQLAGLPAYFGLYASFLPPMIAALFGSSRQLATGPVAIVSLMTSASLAPLATAGSPGYIAYAILLALMVGIFQLSLGILRLGLVVNFLSHPVVNGFTNAAALIIASSQLSKMFGVYVDNAPHHYETIINVIKAAVHYTHWPTLLIGVFAFGIMYGLKWLSPRIPNVLVAVVITTTISWAMGFQHDRFVSIDVIESPEARHLIEEFNRACLGYPGTCRRSNPIW